MKKLGIITMMTALIIMACNSADEGQKETTDETTTTTTTSNTDNPVYKQGVALVGKNGCFACHQIDKKIVGPTYRDVAEKYAGATPEVITALGKKIIEGGSGNWGEAIMTPHPNVSQEDAEAMVKYILLLKK